MINQYVVSIVEYSGHSEVVHSYIRKFSSSVNLIKVFTHQRIMDECYDLDVENVEWHIKKKGDNTYKYLAAQRNEINKADFIIVTTLQADDGHYIRNMWTAKSFLLLHDIQSTFAPYQNLILKEKGIIDTIYNVGRMLKYMFQSSFQKKLRALLTYETLWTPTERMRVSLEQFKDQFKLPQISHSNIAEVQFPPNIDKSEPVIKITIPGTVDGTKIDYKLAMSALAKVSREAKKRIELQLLGRMKDQEVKTFATEFEHEYLKIITYALPVKQRDFNQILSETDFLLLPFTTTCRYYIFEEIPGITKTSGRINDMVRFSLPAIVPEGYPIDQSLSETFTRRFKDKLHLEQLLSYWINKETTNELKEGPIKTYYTKRELELEAGREWRVMMQP